MYYSVVKKLGLSNKHAALYIVLSIVMVLAEVVGISLFVPILHLTATGSDVGDVPNELAILGKILDLVEVIFGNISIQILMIVVLLIFMLRQLLSFTKLWFTAYLKEKTTLSLRRGLLRHYLRSRVEVFDKLGIGALSNVMVKEVDSSMICLYFVLELISYAVLFVLYITVLSYISWQLTSLVFISLLLAYFVSRTWIWRSSAVGKRHIYLNEKVAEFFIEKMRSARLVRLSHTESAEIKEFDDLTRQQADKALEGAVLSAKVQSVVEPIVLIFGLAVFYLALYHFNITIEIIGMYFIFVVRLMPIGKAFLAARQKINNTYPSVEKIDNNLSYLIQNVEDDDGGQYLNTSFNEITFDNVSYQYPDTSLPSLIGINMKFSRKSFVGIVGESGSGKSTTIDLIPRIRKPSDGAVIIDGINYEDIQLASLRSLITFLPQEPQIFSGKLIDHIRYGRAESTYEEVVAACKLAGCHDFIEKLDNKYDTHLTSNAGNLSGGQRQRLDLARVLVSKSPIIILDEPTTGLDANSEAAFIETIEHIRRETEHTIIMISHSLAAVSSADHIYVLNSGKVIQEGNHETLLSENGWYRAAWNSQVRSNPPAAGDSE